MSPQSIAQCSPGVKVSSVDAVHTQAAAVPELPLRLAVLGEELCRGRQQPLKCAFQVESLGHSLNLEGEWVC